MALSDNLSDVMSDRMSDQGWSVPVATLLPGGRILLTLAGVAGPVDAGSVSVVVTQGAATITLAAADGTASALDADETTYDLTAFLPYPLPAGFVGGETDTLVWSYTLAGVAKSVTQYGVLLPNSSITVLDVSCGPPVINFENGTAILEVGATAWLCVPLGAVEESTGADFDLLPLFAAGSVKIALTQTDPTPEDWKTASVLATPGTTVSALYACLLVGVGAVVPAFLGNCRAYVSVTSGAQVVVTRAPGSVLLRG